MKNFSTARIVVMLIGLVLLGCGQKGPLYLPVPPQAPTGERPATVPAPTSPSQK